MIGVAVGDGGNVDAGGSVDAGVGIVVAGNLMDGDGIGVTLEGAVDDAEGEGFGEDLSIGLLKTTPR